MTNLIKRVSIVIMAVAVITFSVKGQDTVAVAPPLTKNPTTAVLLSLPLPGLGQFYNEQYWKIPIFTGTCLFTGYLFFKNNADFNTTSDLYDAAIEGGADDTVLDRLLGQREAFRNNRDLAGMLFLTAYILAAVDAYVGAHMFDFDVGEDLTIGLGPTRTQYAALQLRLQW